MITIILLILATVGLGSQDCYWSRSCPYQLFSSKTPYDAVRGDLRDQAALGNCEPVSIWSINRHGNRNPGTRVTEDIKVIAALKDQIVASYDAGRSQLCAQDIEALREWRWNETLDVSASYLTGVGYEELYDLGKRIREVFPQLLNGNITDYYFRPTDEQRTVTSAIAFVRGLSDGTNLNLVIDDVRDGDEIIRPYENCDRYQQLVKTGPAVTEAVDAYASTIEYIAVQNAVQKRLGITYQLTVDDIYSIYELCRFHRSWNEKMYDPWCSVFTNEDLVILEYRDDVRHYYRNGYGSWVNVNLGKPAMKDLYDNMVAASQGQGRKITAYFTHDTMLEMVFCALGLYKDEQSLQGSRWNVDRLWRTSKIAVMSNNLMAVLNRCQVSGEQTYRVQFFHNEKETTLCPHSGCTWTEFVQKFQEFEDANLDFCSLNYTNVPSSAAMMQGLILVILVQMIVLFLR